MTVAALRALHAVIGSAIDEIERVYKEQSSSTGLPLDYPSLDVPYYSSQQNPPEVAKSEELRLDEKVFGATNQIVAACEQITATVHKPFLLLFEGINGVLLLTTSDITLSDMLTSRFVHRETSLHACCFSSRPTSSRSSEKLVLLDCM